MSGTFVLLKDARDGALEYSRTLAVVDFSVRDHISYFRNIRCFELEGSSWGSTWEDNMIKLKRKDTT